MFTTLTVKGSGRTALIAVASVAGAFAVLGMPGLVSADQPAGPPTIPPVIVNPTNPPIPTIPPVIVNPTNPPIPTIPPVIVNPTFPEPTAPDDFTNPTFPEPTAPDDLTSPDPGEGDDPEVDPADPANPANPANPADPADPADPAAPANSVGPAAQQAPTGQLPETGVDAGTLAVLAVALTAGGTAIVTLARRRADAA